MQATVNFVIKLFELPICNLGSVIASKGFYLHYLLLLICIASILIRF
jgi:hypothetical protein